MVKGYLSLGKGGESWMASLPTAARHCEGASCGSRGRMRTTTRIYSHAPAYPTCYALRVLCVHLCVLCVSLCGGALLCACVGRKSFLATVTSRSPCSDSRARCCSQPRGEHTIFLFLLSSFFFFHFPSNAKFPFSPPLLSLASCPHQKLFIRSKTRRVVRYYCSILVPLHLWAEVIISDFFFSSKYDIRKHFRRVKYGEYSEYIPFFSIKRQKQFVVPISKVLYLIIRTTVMVDVGTCKCY
jgi:hypothetical protein